jgi:tetratricopeptide (TPR) repeat protein
MARLTSADLIYVKHLDQLIAGCQDLIRAGDLNRAALLLGKVNTSRVPRSYRVKLAFLCSRTNSVSQGFRLLAPVVQPRHPGRQAPANAEELAEYANLLEASGNLTEALLRLESINPKETAQTWIYQAYCHMACWRSEEAVRCLEEYLKCELSAERRRLGQLNLASALTGVMDFDRSLDILNGLISSGELKAEPRMLGIAMRTRAAIKIFHKDYASARQDLEHSDQNTGKTSFDYFNRYELLSLLDAVKSNSVDPILKFRHEAEQAQVWFSIRNADLNCLKIKFEKGAFKHLYFGTPFETYRRRIRRELGVGPEEPFYVYGPKKAPRLSLVTGEINGERALNPGKKMHQLVEILLRDFYVPPRLGTLFSELFPGEYFDIHTSPERVHQVLWRTRGWLKDNHFPAEIQERGGYYTLTLEGNSSFLVPLERKGTDPDRVQLGKLHQKFGFDKPFAAKDARELLEISPTAFKKFVARALEQNRLERSGENRFTTYRLKSEVGPSAA